MAKSAIPKPKPISIDKKVRAAHPWYEEGCEKIKQAALDKKREEERLKGPKLKPEEVKKLSDDLERIQLLLNRLELRHVEISKKLLAHWGHTGIEEIEGTKGNTLISTSLSLGVESPSVEKALNYPVWQKVSTRQVNPGLIFPMAEKNMDVKKALLASTKVTRLVVSITPPSSRRPKSGNTDSEE